MSQYVFHLLPNAHLDPVWLWDWREGLNEGIVTCRAILDMMDEDSELTFVRGEATIYRHIEENDPETFARIKNYVKAGRWDVVGGTEIQPDTNLPATETFCRHYLHGKEYFRKKFGAAPTVAWAADSFGHTGGMPEILTACGMDGFCSCRPPYDVVPIEEPAFWWEGFGGSRVLAYRPRWGWYGAERNEMPTRLDQLLEAAQKGKLKNIGVLFGMGNHGGGPSRKQVEDIRAWGQKHPEVKLQFSGFHRYFGSVRQEVARGLELPVHKGELNFVLRGCYSSVAKYKFLYRQAENLVQRAEVASTIVSATKGEQDRTRHGTIGAAWDAILFNSFHDILPGSSIERAFDEQIQWVGGAMHAARKAEFEVLDVLASEIDTRVKKPADKDIPGPAAMLVWNPHPHAFDGYVELETALDYRPIWKYQNHAAEFPLKVTGPDGKAIPAQVIEEEHRSIAGIVWRRRIVTRVNLPALGWNVVQMAWVEGYKAEKVARPTVAKKNFISNGIYDIRAIPGRRGVQIRRGGRDMFGSAGMQVITMDDPWGSWGGMAEQKDSIFLTKVLQTWRITQTHVLESGPLRSTLWVRFEAGQSRLDLTFMLCREREAVDVRARLFINERSVRVKLVFPGCDRAEFEVPAGKVTRGELGHVPGGKWVRAIKNNAVRFGLATDALYDFDVAHDSLRATICRASRYADDQNTKANEVPWRPAVDSGELRFNFLISAGQDELPILADELERQPVSILVPSHDGKRKKSGSLGEITPVTAQLLSLKPAEDGNGLIVRLFNRSDRPIKPVIRIENRKISLTQLKPGRIGTWRIDKSGSVKAVFASEDQATSASKNSRGIRRPRAMPS
ncbi:MAG TPA: glycoside hydrolase family 38 C-terminal domain-containing protein [Tepidisphaeraceae bacterium]|nr:glycoside hydrolase family 38 C-terminal domain-containing protein [Tepidisphaeraceae bacterium]